MGSLLAVGYSLKTTEMQIPMRIKTHRNGEQFQNFWTFSSRFVGSNRDGKVEIATCGTIRHPNQRASSRFL